MIKFVRACSGYFLFAGLFSLFINTLYMTFPLYMLAVYTRVLSAGSMPTLMATTLLALAALAVLSCLDLARSRLLVRAGIRLDALLTPTVLEKMLRELCLSDSRSYTKGLQDINTLRTYLGGNSIFAFFDVPWIFIYLAVIYLVHPILGMTATAGAVVILVIGLLQGGLTKGRVKQAGKLSDQARAWVGVSLRTARELHSMGMAKSCARVWADINDREMAMLNHNDRINHLFGAVSRSFSILMQVVIFGVGAALVLANEANPGVIIASSIIMGRALAPVTQGISAWKQTSDAKAAYKNLNDLIQRSAGRGQPMPETFQGRVEVKEVSLAIKDAQVLDRVDFSLAPGEGMGLIGHNGAGKTTLCRMILGMWAPTGGQVLLDGLDATRLDQDGLGRCLGYLPQNVELFSGTVSENIARMGDVDPAAVVAAAKLAGAHDTILGFPGGYDTQIGESGLNLSGGQRQRVALARALYGTPGLVILDEPNSNLDTAGEQALMSALAEMKKRGVTTIMITHKPELLSTMDRILVLEKGEMARFGSRAEVFGQMMGDNECNL